MFNYLKDCNLRHVRGFAQSSVLLGAAFELVSEGSQG